MMKSKISLVILALAIVAAIFISGCVQKLAPESKEGLQIVIKDVGFPEVKYLQPTIKEVQLLDESGKWTTIWSNQAGKTVKLTPDGAEVVLDAVSVEAGTYVGTRLMVSVIEVEVDINKDGDTLDKNVEVVLTEAEFNSLPAKEKPQAPQAPTAPSPPSQPTAPTQPTPPTQPSQPSSPSPPEGQGGQDNQQQPEQPPEPTQPSAPSQPQEPERPPEPTQPAEPPQPQAPYRIEGGLVYTGEYLDEKHTITLSDYIVPLFEDKFIYGGSGGKIIYDFTLHPLLPKHEQISVEVSIVVNETGPPINTTVLFDDFNSTTKGKGFGALTYEDSMPNLGKAVNLAKGNYIKYSFSPWYRWDGVHSWNRNEAAPGVLTEGTIEMWIKPRRYSGMLTFNWGDMESSPQAGYIMHFGFNADGRLTYDVWGGHLDTSLVGKTTIPLNKWTHVAVSWSPDGTKLYVNEKLDASTSANMWPAFSGTVFAYLNYWGGDDLGLVDDFRISKVAEPPTIVPPAAAQTWIQLSPDGPQLARHHHSAGFDPDTNQMIVFGGISDPNRFNDVWRLSSANGIGTSAWVSVIPSGTPPALRQGQSGVYDQVNDRMIIFGGGLGFTSPCANDVWVLKNAGGKGGTPEWEKLSPSGAPPGPRYGHSAVYDSKTNSLIIYAGQDCFTLGTYNDVWVLSNANGLGGTPTWSKLSPSGVQLDHNRDFHMAIYDETTNRMIVFSGRSKVSLDNNDVWVLTNANGMGGTPAWMELSPSGTPPEPRSNLNGVYDPVNNRLVIFGGASHAAQKTYNDVWVLSNANGLDGTPEWLQLSPSGGLPPARVGYSAVYDLATNRMMIFGGQVYPATFSDVWVLTDANGIIKN